MKEETKSELLERLNKDRIGNSFLINSVESVDIDSYAVYNDSIALHQSESGFWLFSIAEKEDIRHIFSRLEKPLNTFYVNDSSFFPAIQEMIPKAQADEYVQFVLESDKFQPRPDAVNSAIDVVELDKSWTDFILSLYHSEEFGHKEYIDRCIELNSGYGAIWNGERVGYVTVHLDGEIGSMVISEYARGQGVGKTLMQHITPAYAARASIGCGFVLPENVASQRMMVDSCFEALENNVIWVYH